MSLLLSDLPPEILLQIFCFSIVAPSDYVSHSLVNHEFHSILFGPVASSGTHSVTNRIRQHVCDCVGQILSRKIPRLCSSKSLPAASPSPKVSFREVRFLNLFGYYPDFSKYLDQPSEDREDIASFWRSGLSPKYREISIESFEEVETVRNLQSLELHYLRVAYELSVLLMLPIGTSIVEFLAALSGLLFVVLSFFVYEEVGWSFWGHLCFILTLGIWPLLEVVSMIVMEITESNVRKLDRFDRGTSEREGDGEMAADQDGDGEELVIDRRMRSTRGRPERLTHGLGLMVFAFVISLLLRWVFVSSLSLFRSIRRPIIVVLCLFISEALTRNDLIKYGPAISRNLDSELTAIGWGVYCVAAIFYPQGSMIANLCVVMYILFRLYQVVAVASHNHRVIHDSNRSLTQALSPVLLRFFQKVSLLVIVLVLLNRWSLVLCGIAVSVPTLVVTYDRCPSFTKMSTHIRRWCFVFVGICSTRWGVQLRSLQDCPKAIVKNKRGVKL